MFDQWADKQRTAYLGYEQSSSKGAVRLRTPYPYWRGYPGFAPYRIEPYIPDVKHK
jgi:hypothetical protein